MSKREKIDLLESARIKYIDIGLNKMYTPGSWLVLGKPTFWKCP